MKSLKSWIKNYWIEFLGIWLVLGMFSNFINSFKHTNHPVLSILLFIFAVGIEWLIYLYLKKATREESPKTEYSDKELAKIEKEEREFLSAVEDLSK